MNLLQKYEKRLKELKIDDEDFNAKITDIAIDVIKHNNDKLSFEFCKIVYSLFGKRNLLLIAFLISENSSFYASKVIDSIEQSQQDKGTPPSLSKK